MRNRESTLVSDDTAFKENAALVMRTCRRLVDFEFGYDERSIAWLEKYIERLQIDGAFKEDFEKFAGMFGCYLGEAIIACYGGQWCEDDDDPAHVLLDNDIRAFPFAKVQKQMKNGLASGDSILGFFRTIPALLSMQREKR